MGNSSTITVRVEQTMKERLDQLAQMQRRSKSFVVGEAIAEYVAMQEAQIRGIEEAIAAADRGEVIPHEKIRSWVDSLHTDKPLAKPTA